MLHLNIMPFRYNKQDFSKTIFQKKVKNNMKKNKIITLSILGLLLFIPFMTPTRAAPASYVPVAEEEGYFWELSNYNTNILGQFTTDNMSAVIGEIFSTPAEWQISKVYTDWSTSGAAPQSGWPLTVKAILPENTSALLSDYYIFDNITYTPVFLGTGFFVINYWGLGYDLAYDDTWYIVDDTASFAAQSLYSASAFSPYTLQGVPFGPKNINWTEFVALANWGMGGFWTGDAVNTTVTELASGYSLSIPALGFGSNSLPITIDVTYTTDGILNNYTFNYGADTLFFYELTSYDFDALDPVTTSPSDLSVFNDYTGESITWTATDLNPGNYTITRNGTTVKTTTPWTNGSAVTYNITDGLTSDTIHAFEITFADTGGNSISDTVLMTVTTDTTDPVITVAPSDITHTLAVGEVGESISWTATDANAGTYIVKVNGTIDVLATAWVSGTPVNYYASYVPGVTTIEITFTDLNDNSVSDSVTMTVSGIPSTTTPPPGIPGFDPLIVVGITVIASISLIAFKKRKK